MEKKFFFSKKRTGVGKNKPWCGVSADREVLDFNWLFFWPVAARRSITFFWLGHYPCAKIKAYKLFTVNNFI